MSPWEILGIPRGPVEEKEIRRAYAAKVREHPPDVDPDGFRRVREAYEFLCSIARSLRRGEPGEPGPPSSKEEDLDAEDGAAPESPLLSERAARRRASPEPAPAEGSAPDQETPEGVEADWDRIALDEVRAAAALPPGPDRDRGLREAMLHLADRMRRNRHLVPLWGRAALGALDEPERPWLLAAATRPRDLVLDLFEAEGEVADRVISCLRGRGHLRQLADLARDVLREPSEPRNDVAPVLSALAASVAVLDHELAEALADRAFRSALRKESAVPEALHLESRIAAGREASRAAEGIRLFLAQRVEGVPWDPSKSANLRKAALRFVTQLAPSSALRALLEAEAAGFLPASPLRRRSRREKKEMPRSILLSIFLATGIAGLLRSCDREQPRRPSVDPATLRRESEEMRRRIRESAERDPAAFRKEFERKLRERLRRPPDAPPPPR